MYPYRCTACGHKFEKIQSFSSEPETVCPKCGGALVRVLTAPGLNFKGAGWYINDYAPKSSSSSDSSASDSAGDSSSKSGDSSSDSKSESKKTDSASPLTNPPPHPPAATHRHRAQQLLLLPPPLPRPAHPHHPLSPVWLLQLQLLASLLRLHAAPSVRPLR
jgi:putative FmdB family regulatory protein